MIKCEDECPLDKPIYDNETNSCTLKYCTKEQFENEECIISNKIIKEQWLSRILHISNTTKMIYPTIALGTNNDLFFETNIGRTRKIFYSMEENGRGFMDESQFNYIEFNNNNNIFTTYGNSALVTINNNKCFFKLSFYESIEMYDLVEKKYTINKLESFFRYKIQSYYNSLLRTKEENVFIYAYITTGNYLAMQKFKIITNDASNCTQIIKTLIEEEKTIPKNSRKCLITDTQYIECLDMDVEQTYYIRLYDKDLNFKKKFKLDNNNSPLKRAYSIYHEASFLKNSMSIFIYFTKILKDNFNCFSDVRLIGQGSYFTDNLDYVWFYTGNRKRERFFHIPKVNQTFSFIASEIYYDKTKEFFEYNVDNRNNIVERNGIRRNKVDGTSTILTREEIILKLSPLIFFNFSLFSIIIFSLSLRHVFSISLNFSFKSDLFI